jgi:hypothetical protein
LLTLNLAAHYCFGEGAETPVIRLFDGIGKDTRRQFLIAPVITDTLAAQSLARAGFVSAITAFEISLLVTFHTDYFNE